MDSTVSSEITWHMMHEVFEFAYLRFDVDAAKRIVAVVPHEIIELPIADMSRWLGPPPARRSPGRLTLAGMLVDWSAVECDDVDLSVPIIIAQLPDSSLPIDGWRRIAKATIGGVKVLPAVVLTCDETHEVMSS